jgi:hypothetical protein
MRTACKLLAATLVLASVYTVGGQPPGGGDEDTPMRKKGKEAKPGPKSKLEEMLAQALQNNPDIRVAKAKQEQAKAMLNEAEAEVNRAILQVSQKVTALNLALERRKAQAAAFEEQYLARKKEYESGSASASLYQEAKRFLIEAKAQVAESESELALLLGKAPPGTEGVRIGQADATCVQCHQNPSPETWDEKMLLAAHKVIGFKTDWVMSKKATKGPVAEKIRQALDTPVTVTFKQQPVDKILKDLLDKLSGVPVLYRIALARRYDFEVKDPIPLGAVLQMFADKCDNTFQLVIREYGILVTPPDLVPPGAMTLDEFWKKAREKPKDPLENQPSEGEVRALDSKSGLVQLSIDSDAGWKAGQIVHVFRLSQKPSESKYLGTLRIVQVRSTDAVAEPTKDRGMTEPPRPGDRVAVRMTGN